MKPSDEQVWMMLGEIRTNVAYLVKEHEKTKQAQREQDDRISRLEHFRTRIGVLATALGVTVPTAITAAAHRLGLV